MSSITAAMSSNSNHSGWLLESKLIMSDQHGWRSSALVSNVPLNYFSNKSTFCTGTQYLSHCCSLLPFYTVIEILSLSQMYWRHNLSRSQLTSRHMSR